jgi:hypothetical protein
VLLVALCVLGASACGAPAVAAHEREILVRTWVFGAFGSRSVDVRDLCGADRARRVEFARRFPDYVAGVVTLGMYVPHRIRVECGGAPSP